MNVMNVRWHGINVRSNRIVEKISRLANCFVFIPVSRESVLQSFPVTTSVNIVRWLLACQSILICKSPPQFLIRITTSTSLLALLVTRPAVEVSIFVVGFVSDGSRIMVSCHAFIKILLRLASYVVPVDRPPDASTTSCWVMSSPWLKISICFSGSSEVFVWPSPPSFFTSVQTISSKVVSAIIK